MKFNLLILVFFIVNVLSAQVSPTQLNRPISKYPNNKTLTSLIKKLGGDTLINNKQENNPERLKLYRDLAIEYYYNNDFETADYFFSKSKRYKESPAKSFPQPIIKEIHDTILLTNSSLSINEMKSIANDNMLLDSLPSNLTTISKDDIIKLSVLIDRQISKLIKERNELLKNYLKNKNLIKEKNNTIKALKKERDIITLSLEKDSISEEKSLYKKFLIWSAISIALLILFLVILFQKKIIHKQDEEIESKIKEINKKTAYLEHAAKLIRHDMHSGINTYIPRGLTGLEKKLTSSDIKNLKIDSSLKLIKDGLEHTQKVYNNVYEFTNLVKKETKLDKKKVDLFELITDKLEKTSFKSQVFVDKLCLAEINEILFWNAIENLIKNGLKYNNNENKKVKIYLDGNNLIIEDNGLGLSTESFLTIVNNYSIHNDNSLNLGLNIANAIIEEHGFKLSCEKIATGTKIIITLNKQKLTMIDSLMLVDDEDLFHLVFEDACSLLDITLSLQSLNSADEAAELFKKWQKKPENRPECVFVDLNIIGSSFDGIELIRRINFEYGNNVVIGIISSSDESEEQAKAIQAGAQFWIIKTDEIEPRLEDFKKDYEGYKKKTAPFKIYK